MLSEHQEYGIRISFCCERIREVTVAVAVELVLDRAPEGRVELDRPPGHRVDIIDVDDLEHTGEPSSPPTGGDFVPRYGEASPTMTTEAINQAIRLLSLRHRARAAALLAPLGLHPGQEVLLLELARTGPMIQAKLSEALSIEPPSVTLMTNSVTINGWPTVMMTYRGAKTGKVRKTPLMRVEHEGRYAAVGSNGGEPTNPQWYASLISEPDIELQDSTVTRQYRARQVYERALWWRRAVDAFPGYADYPHKTDRQIPMLVLEPTGEDTGK